MKTFKQFLLTTLLILGLATLSLAAGDGVTTFRGVFVGIDQFGTCASGLSWCDDDAIDLYNILSTYENWNVFNMTMLLNTNATKANVQNALIAALQAADNDDVVLYTDSGHGGNIEDTNGDEPDYYDETIYMSGSPPNCTITDDEFTNLVMANLKPGCGFSAVFDTCYSGGFIEGNKGKEGKLPVGARTPYDPEMNSHKLTDDFGTDIIKAINDRNSQQKDLNNVSNCVILTGCAYNELAGESGSIQNGYFSYYLIEGFTGLVADDADPDNDVSAEEEYAWSYPRTVAANPSQHPQMSDTFPYELPLAGDDIYIPVNIFEFLATGKIK